MGRHRWTVRNAVVEEEIGFESKEEFEHYLFTLDCKKEPYKVVSERPNGRRYIAVIRKRYGEYPFLGEPDAPTTNPALIECWQREKARREEARREKEQREKERYEKHHQELAEAGIYLREDV